jgi:hypothetical protein
MPLTHHEVELRKAALERIERGALPRQVPKMVWAGRGSGQPCSLCDQTIGHSETEYELAASGGASAHERIVRLHLQCHALWQLAVVALSSAIGVTRSVGDAVSCPNRRGEL